MRIAIYARKSTDSEDRQVQSLDDQLRDLRKLADREQHVIVGEYVESISAKAPDQRPEFSRLIAAVEAGEVEGILTWAINRLSRNPVDGGRIAYLLQTGRLSMIQTVQRTYRPDDNALLISIENGMATAYIQDLSHDVKRGMRGKFERGWHACKAPIGYKNDKNTREIVADPERFDIVRGAWDMLLGGGYSVTKIHAHLTRVGLTVSNKRREPGPVSLSAVFNIFKNPFYTGLVQFKGESKQGKHPAMVTLDEFERAQKIVTRTQKPKVRKQGLSFAFTDVFRCAACGCAVIGERKVKTYPRTNRTATYLYYHCSRSKGCSGVAVRQEDVEREFQRHAERIGIRRPFAEWLSDALASALERNGVQETQELVTSQTELDRGRAQLERITMMRADGEISAEEFGKTRSRILDRVEELSSNIRRHQSRSARIMRRANELIETAVAAGELRGGNNDPFALAAFARACGNHLLNLGTPIFRIDPVLEKIAAFEPLRDGSETPKRGDLLPLNSVWWTLVEDILNLILVADSQEKPTLMQSTEGSRI